MSFSTKSAALALIALAPAATAQIGTYAQDFETLDAGNSSALDMDGWLVFGNVTDPAGNYLYGYGPFPAPNHDIAFSNIAGGQGGAAQGTQYLNVYSDYQNADHANGNLIESIVFQERTIVAGDVGKTIEVSFDYLKNPLVINGATTVTTDAFVKVIKQSDGTFALIGGTTLDTTGASDMNWASDTLTITIDPTWVGELFQFGFSSVATGYEDTGRFYDNIVVGEPVIGTNYCNANPNSTGVIGMMSADGSDVAADNNLTLTASNLPINQFGIFIVGPGQGFVPGLGGTSNGNLCISAPIGRFTGPGQILPTTGGSFSLTLDLTGIPQGAGTVPVTSGQTWYFQAWHRDGVGLGSNLTDGLQIDFN